MVLEFLGYKGFENHQNISYFNMVPNDITCELMKNYGKALYILQELISEPRKAHVDEVPLSHGMKCHLWVNLGVICLFASSFLFI